MSTPTTTAKPPGRPSPQTKAMSALLARLRNATERHGSHYAISSQSAATVGEREALEARKAELDSGLHPADPRSAAGRVLQLMVRYPSTAALSTGRTDEMVKAYGRDLSRFPLWAIDAACIATIRGGGAFMPSAPELAAACEREIYAMRSELATISRALDAAVYSETGDEERARMKAAFKALAEEIGLSSDPRVTHPRQPTRQEAAEWIAEAKEAGPQPPPQISGELRAKIGGAPAKASAA